MVKNGLITLTTLMISFAGITIAHYAAFWISSYFLATIGCAFLAAILDFDE